MSEIEYELLLSDITLNECGGDFNKVKGLMQSEPPFNDKWAIRSDITLVSPSGCCEMVVQFNGNGRVYIVSYRPSMPDVFYNMDIRILTQWLQENGWRVPEPSIDIIESNKDFWKHFYDTLLIDSEYFDKRYGERDHVQNKN